MRAEAILCRLASDGAEQEEIGSRATEALGNAIRNRRSQIVLAQRLFDPSTGVKISALCAIARLTLTMPEFLKSALAAKLDDPSRLDDERVVSIYAARILKSI